MFTLKSGIILFGALVVALLVWFNSSFIERLSSFVSNINFLLKLIPILFLLYPICKQFFGNSNKTESYSGAIKQIANVIDVPISIPDKSKNKIEKLSNKEKRFLSATQGWRCAKCDEKLNSETICVKQKKSTIEFVTETTKRSDDLENFEIVCEKCNQ
jgi:hypothetical protein